MPKSVSITPKFLGILAALTVAAGLGACRAAEESGSQARQVASGRPAAGTPEGARSGTGNDRAVETLDICALVPAAEVAEVLGYEPSSASAKATMGRWASDCTYDLKRGDGSSDYAMIWAYPPELWAPDLDGDTEVVSGLGDAADVSKTGGFTQFKILLEGDLFLDTRAETPDRARALAELAIDRLAGAGGAR